MTRAAYPALRKLAAGETDIWKLIEKAGAQA